MPKSKFLSSLSLLKWVIPHASDGRARATRIWHLWMRTGGNAMKGIISSVTVSTKDCIYVKPGYHISARCSMPPMQDFVFQQRDCTSGGFPDLWLLLGFTKVPRSWPSLASLADFPHVAVHQGCPRGCFDQGVQQLLQDGEKNCNASKYLFAFSVPACCFGR